MKKLFLIATLILAAAPLLAADDVAATNLMAWYPLNGPFSGQTTDASGHNNTVCSFIPASGWLNVGMNYTISLWVKPSSGGTMCLVEWNSAGNIGAHIFLNVLGPSTVFFNAGYDRQADGFLNEANLSVDPSTVDARCSLNTHAFLHVACTYDGTTMKIYCGGVLVASQPYTPSISFVSTDGITPATIGDVCIGFRRDHPENNYIGNMDDLRIYNRALTQAEILKIKK